MVMIQRLQGVKIVNSGRPDFMIPATNITLDPVKVKIDDNEMYVGSIHRLAPNPLGRMYECDFTTFFGGCINKSDSFAASLTEVSLIYQFALHNLLRGVGFQTWIKTSADSVISIAEAEVATTNTTELQYKLTADPESDAQAVPQIDLIYF